MDFIIDRKSVFLAHGAYISDPKDPKVLWNYMLNHRRIARATHNITAYRLVTEKDGREVIYQDCDDDGEDAAGKRLLHLLQLANVRNVWVCVSRWFGGIHLGPDRFSHINNVARLVLNEMGALESKKSKDKT
jgi:putative IMPACT (imprinted ancient) family translation regulator